MTKRLLYRLMAGFAAFAIGVSLSSIWNAHRPISLCELDANPDSYAGKTIRFRGIVNRNRDYITAASFCGNGTAAAVSIELPLSEVAKFPLPESPGTSDSEIYNMDAVIIGDLDSDIGMGCFAPKYHILNARVERVISVHQSRDLQEAIQWFKSNSY